MAGIMPLNSSMNVEPDRGPMFRELNSEYHTPEFVIWEDFREMRISVAFGAYSNHETAKFWHGEMKRTYSGEAGRLRLREALINLDDRDGLRNRLYDIRCPVLWLHGDRDGSYLVRDAREADVGSIVGFGFAPFTGGTLS